MFHLLPESSMPFPLGHIFAFGNLNSLMTKLQFAFLGISPSYESKHTSLNSWLGKILSHSSYEYYIQVDLLS